MVIRKRLKIKQPALVFVTSATFRHQPIFANDTAARILLDQMNKTSEAFNVSIVGYVVMPTHFHGLFGLPDYSHLSKFMGSLKSLSSRRIKELMALPVSKHIATQSDFRLWADRFDDIIITSEEQFRTKLNYIHNNPVKANLVANPVMWKYSSASDWLMNEKGLLNIDRDFSWTKV